MSKPAYTETNKERKELNQQFENNFPSYQEIVATHIPPSIKVPNGKPTGGRQTFQYNYAGLEAFCRINPTNLEIATYLGISEDTYLNRMKDDTTFSAAVKRGRETGKSSLRRRQWQTAMTDRQGSYLMQIFLGKQYLNQADVRKTESTIDVTMKAQLKEWFKPKQINEPQDVVETQDYTEVEETK